MRTRNVSRLLAGPRTTNTKQMIHEPIIDGVDN